MASSFIFYLLRIADVDILFYNLGQTFKWLTCTENNTPYILDRREYTVIYVRDVFLAGLSRKDPGTCYRYYICYHYYYNINKLLLADLIYCCKTRVKMLVFDRPSFFPLFWLLQFSPLYTASPFHFHTCA